MQRQKRTIILPVLLILAGSTLSPWGESRALTQQDSVSIDGITWRFSQSVPVGRFVNGHHYVVGPVTITSIDPSPSPGRNGSVLNLPVDQGISGFDDRVSSNRYREEIRSDPPIAMQPGDALVSSISVGTMGELPAWLRESDAAASPVRSVSVLTCLSEEVPADAFRPSYCDRTQRIYHADSLKRGLLPDLPRVSGAPDIADWAWHFARPWLDVCFFGFDAATLLLMCDFTAAEKEPLLINFVQYGIDLWGIATAGYPGWQAHGGHGSGRKWPIVFAGIMLGEPAIQSPGSTLPDIRFGEDMQTMYDNCWTGANVVYAGHTGVIDGVPVSGQDGWGPYEHLPPAEWYDDLGESYRRCCTSLSWVGQALSARLLGAEALWDHDAFFDYVDRWMTEDDADAVVAIEAARGWDFSASWARQGQCWDEFVENMWAGYRWTQAVKPGPAPRGPVPSRTSAEARNLEFYSLAGKLVSPGSLRGARLCVVKERGSSTARTALLPGR
jgi:hypothetical protein